MRRGQGRGQGRRILGTGGGGKRHVSSGRRVSSPEIPRELGLSIKHPLSNARLRVPALRAPWGTRQWPASRTVQLKGRGEDVPLGGPHGPSQL